MRDKELRRELVEMGILSKADTYVSKNFNYVGLIDRIKYLEAMCVGLMSELGLERDNGGAVKVGFRKKKG